MNRIISAKEFIQEITKEADIVLVENVSVKEMIDLDGINLSSNGIELKNCTFEHPVIFENINFNAGIKFRRCRFLESISFNSCKATGVNNDFNFEGYHFDFQNTEIGELYFIFDNVFERGLRINRGSDIGKIELEGVQVVTGGMEISASKIRDGFTIRKCSFGSSVTIKENTEIKSKVRFDNLVTHSLNFLDSNFEKDVHIWSGKIQSLVFNDGCFDDDIYIKGVKIPNRMSIIGTVFKRTVNIDIVDGTNDLVGNLSEVYIRSIKCDEQLTVNGNIEPIDKVQINCSKKLEGTFVFNSCDIKVATLTGSNYTGDITFDGCLFQSLQMESLKNYFNISFLAISSFGEGPEIFINRSTLGRMSLFNADLSTFQKISIHNSVLTELIAVNVKWFKDKALNPAEFEVNNHTQRREVYRQIKYALESQGNKIDSLTFKALEMKANKKEVFQKVKWRVKIFNKDRFILWLAQSNNYGQHWVKPLLILLVMALVFHFLIIVGVSDKLEYSFNITWDSTKITFVEYFDNFKSYFQIMNPTHSLIKVFPKVKEIGGMVYFYDYVFRLVFAFLVFQIIVAFRKYAK